MRDKSLMLSATGRSVILHSANKELSLGWEGHRED